MDKFQSAVEILNLIRQPAFCVKEHIITHVNSAAEPLLIEPGTEIKELLSDYIDAYQSFNGGCLYLAVTVAGVPLGAAVSRVQDFDIFLLEESAETKQLQTLSLAAQSLREPLAGMMTAAEQLSQSLSKEDGQCTAQFSNLQRGLHQMLRLVSNMSDAARYVQQKSTVMETHNVSTLFQEIFSAAAVHIGKARRTLEFYGLNQDLFCLVNPDQLERAVHNLLSNAVKFSPEGSCIQARLTRNRHMLYLTVENQGDGTVKNPEQNFFSAFFREPGISDGRHGIGMGMVFVRGAVLAHGGTVLVQQTENGGNRVTISITIRQNTAGTLRSHTLRVDYLGELNHGLVEFSEILPPSAYHSDF